MIKNNDIDYTEKVLEIKNLRQYFKAGQGRKKFVVKAVDDISFDIYKREVFGLVGESGCGKTTTGRTIIKLYDATDGTIKFNSKIVGSGHSGSIHLISKERKKAKVEILKANPYKYETYLVNEDRKNQTNELKKIKKALKKELDNTIEKIEFPISNFHRVKSEKNRLLKIEQANIEYDYIKRIARLKGSSKDEITTNKEIEITELREKIRNEIEILSYQKIDKKEFKVQKKEIENRLSSEIEIINKKAELDFESAKMKEKEVIDRKKEITTALNDKNARIKEITIEHKKEIEQLELNLPTKESLNNDKNKEIKNFNTKTKEIDVKLNQINEEAKIKKAKVVEKYKNIDYKIDSEKIKAEKLRIAVLIRTERQKIKDAKHNNEIVESKEEKIEYRKNIAKINSEYKNDLEKCEKRMIDIDDKNSDEYKKLYIEKSELIEAHNLELKTAKSKRVNKINVMSKMQMIFQDPIASLNPRMIVKEIIAEGLRIQGIKNEKLITEKVNKSLELVGLLPEHASRYPHEFSGGQRQRIGIARSLIVNPDFIIADEPISALDVSIQAQVINLLTSLKEELGLTILFVAHDLSIVKYFSDRIAVMYFGKIVELTTSEELFKNPLHPYTKALLSAIPHPDPDYEKTRKRLIYSSNIHDYSIDKPKMYEIKKGHFIYANEKELLNYKKELSR